MAHMTQALRVSGTLIAFLLIAAGFARASGFAPLPYRPPASLPDDRRDIPAPAERPVNVWEDSWDRQFTEQMAEMFDFARLGRRIAGRPKEALNADAFDDVANSSWYTHRSGSDRLIADDGSACPDTAGEWTVFKAKMTGMAPGMFIKDATGRRFIVKFDPKGFPELSTGAEVVNARFLHAAGYNVPSNCIVRFRPGNVKVGSKVGLLDRRGRKRNMSQADLAELFARVDTLSDGSVRAAASTFIPGKGMGPFLYKGTRKDDPNDIVPHEHRREVRALRVLFAWLKRFDINSGNTYDAYQEEDGRHFVKHYLIDFGGDLGASLYGPTPPARGQENVVDPHQIGLNILTLGLLVPAWERRDTTVIHVSVGRYDPLGFHPAKFKFITPAKAFELMTDRDGYWGARLAMSFDDSLIRALVETGSYRDPAAVDYFVAAIRERRDITGRYWFGRMAPLDSLRVGEDGKLRFADLAVARGLEPAGLAGYSFAIRGGDAKTAIVASGSLPSPADGLSLPAPASIRSLGARGRPALAVDLGVTRPGARRAPKPIRVHLEGDAATGRWTLVGVER